MRGHVLWLMSIRAGRSREDEDFQMAPMIDMVFLLLVFFMTVSTMAKDARPEMELAQSSAAVVPVAAPPRTIISVFAVADGYEHWLGNRVVRLEELGELLLEDSAARVTEVTLRAAFDLPWEGLRPVMDACAAAGVETMHLATFEP